MTRLLLIVFRHLTFALATVFGIGAAVALGLGHFLHAAMLVASGVFLSGVAFLFWLAEEE